MAPELKLGVGLDLAYFRQQVRKAVNIAQSEFTAQLNLKINRQALQRETNYLTAYFRRKNYRIEVKTNLDAEIIKADNLIKKLNDLDGKTVSVNIATTGGLEAAKSPAQIQAEVMRGMQEVSRRGAARMAGLGGGGVTESARRAQFERMLLEGNPERGVSKRTVERSKRTGLRGLRDIATEFGIEFGKSLRREALAKLIAEKASIEQISNFDPQMRLRPLRGQSQFMAPRSTEGLSRIINSIASATTNPRAAGLMLRQLPESRITTGLAGTASRQARYFDEIPNARATAKATGFDPLLKAISLNFSDYAKNVSASDPWIGKIGTGVRDLIARATQSSVRGQLALPAAGQSSSSQMARSMLQGLEPLRAPSTGPELGKYASFKIKEIERAAQPIANRLRDAAIEFSKNAPIVSQYLNTFRARKMDISDLPGAEESPGQYIRRIQEAMRQGPFGPGTVISGGGGGFRFGQGPQMPGFPLQRALPPAGMTTAAGGPNYPYDRVTGDGGGGGGGGRGGAIVPYAPRTELPAKYFTGGKIQQALKGADQYLKQSRVPLTGAIQELGSEFGNAVKQVLLFGTAYKALAFIVDLPNQALSAATALQTFNNQLLAVTGSTSAASQAFSFVDGLAERFNVPLESARQGFIRLYASMEPAGFAPDQIEGLFTGISKAAATFGLSADQVDRVTYAFSQMASKGQLMTEELKGQLGDVLPGSLALFARAAQMSIPEFTKALEDGAFKGEAFQALLRNVAKLMNTEFAGGAAGAANTLQGRMNDLSNSVTKMYESFEPLVGLISAQVFPQLSGIIGDATEAIQAFVGGIQGAEDPAAQLSSRGLAIYEALRQVADIGQSLQGIISALAPTFGVLANVVLFVVQNIAKLLNTGAGQWLAKLAVQTALATAALQLMAKAGLFAAIRGLVLLATNAQAAIVALKTLIVTSRIAKIALGGLVVGAVLVFFEVMASKADQANSKLRSTAKFARDLKGELDSLAAAGDVTEATARYTAAEQKIASFNKSIKILEEVKERTEKFLPDRETTQQEFEKLKSSGLASGMTLRRNIFTGEATLTGIPSNIEANIEAAREAKNRAAIESGIAKEAMKSAVTVRSGQQAQQTSLETIDLSAGKSDNAKKQSLESYYNLEDSLAKAQSEADIDRIQALHDHRINMINAVYDLQEARANSHQKEAIRFERELMNIELNRQSAVLKASLDVRKARESVAGGAIAGPGGSGSIVERLTGDPSSPYYRADHGGANYHEHLAFATKVQRDAAMKALEAQGIKIGSVNDGRHAPGSYHYSDQAFDVPGSQVPVGQEAELSRRVMSILADAGFTGGGITADTGGAGGARKISSSERREILADMKTSLAIAKESIVVKQAEELATKETAIALEKYAASIAPVEETKLQNKLLEERGKLIRAGVSQEDIDMRIQLYETEQRVALGIAAINKLRTEGIYTDEKAQNTVNRLQQAYEDLNDALTRKNELQKQSEFDVARTGLQNRLSMAGAITPGQEIRERLRQEGRTPEKVEQLAQLEELAIKAEEIKAIYQNVAQTIGSAFGQAFQDVVNGSKGMQEALSDMLQSIGESFVAMAAEIIAKQVAMITLQAILKALGGPSFSGGGGGGGGGLPLSGGDVSNFNTTGFGNLSPQAFPVIGSANGNVLKGGFQAFANGGVVKGPTLGLVGEGRYNEAIVPLPDGRSIPVQMQGASSSRQLLSEREARQKNSPSVLSMSFETTNINGVEYVSRDQLEQAMASTRKAAARDGAAQGSRLTLDKLKNSPTTRRQIGIS